MSVSMTMPILVVDDYNTMIRIVRNLLRQIGFTNIEEANDGASALRKLRQKPYQLVISDWNMAPMTGGELLERMRADDSLRNTPFVVLTGEGRADAVNAASQTKTSSYIVKPFNALALRQKLVDVLGDF